MLGLWLGLGIPRFPERFVRFVRWHVMAGGNFTLLCATINKPRVGDQHGAEQGWLASSRLRMEMKGSVSSKDSDALFC
ncbi:hypothetical protein E2C01_048157 [Portunus trituberculatus]|uniref:Uncharacterized protein n=1 Tax=Portunus trituberculatus TaxID=210409 RepID=A0A5B7G9V1_PORTR|nr:hypothetical protein [Portunus trituberculatus]